MVAYAQRCRKRHLSSVVRVVLIFQRPTILRPISTQTSSTPGRYDKNQLT